MAFKWSHENLKNKNKTKKLSYSLLAYVLKSKGKKKSFSGAVRITISENITFINISISKDYKIMRCGNKKTLEWF